MILPVNEKYRISGNEHCWELQKVRHRKDRVTKKPISDWESFQYFNSLEKAVQSLSEYMIRTADTQTLVEAYVEVDRVVATLCTALTPQFEVKVRVEQHD